MHKLSDIKILQLEISNYCNAACPQCPRNYFGGKTISTLPLSRWSLSVFKKLFTPDLLKSIEEIYFCGTYGDPLTNSSLVDMCSFLKNINPNIKVGIHTNGGVGKPETFQKLARVVDFVAFGIDGLEDTNHIYRRNVSWNRIIKNTQAFISAGGNAIWDYIVFAHNQHQVETAKKLSEDYGFSSFSIKRTVRFLDRTHNYSDSMQVYNKDGFIDYSISAPTDVQYLNSGYEKIEIVQEKYNSLSEYAQQTCISCNSQRIKEVYIGADGFVFPCGWLHDRLYGPDVESHQDHIKIKNLMKEAGGWDKVNIFHTDFKEIVNNTWFDIIANSWQNENRLDRCGIMCGNDINLVKSQNIEVKYKI
jgi:MoaA/NifB/PqqE/SkfB family radical SAM enzyme